MAVIINLVLRNLKIFLRNKMAVFFSFLSVIIIIALYALFLGKVQVDSIERNVGGLSGVRFLVDSWIMAGLLAVNTVTVGLGAMGVMVQDMESRLINDFLVAPLSRTKIVFSYLISSYIIGFVLSIISFVACEIYILASGGELLGYISMIKTVGLIALCVVSSNSIMFFFVTFIKSETAFSTLSTIVGTMIGFVTGVYMPVGVLPEAVQKFVALVPISHGAAALRQVFMSEPLNIVYGNAPAEAMEEYIKIYGVRLFWGDNAIGMPVMLGVLGGVGALFIILSILRLRKMKDS